MTQFTLSSDVRVRTASGDAMFTIPGTGVVLECDGQFAAQWIDLTAGTEVTLCAKFEKTDTFMLAVTQPAHLDEETGDRLPAMTNGFVLRRKSWENLLEAQHVADTAVTDASENELLTANLG